MKWLTPDVLSFAGKLLDQGPWFYFANIEMLVIWFLIRQLLREARATREALNDNTRILTEQSVVQQLRMQQHDLGPTNGVGQ